MTAAREAAGTRHSGALVALARGGSVNLLGSVVTAVCAFALTVVVARAQSREAAGVFFSTTSVFLLVTTLGQLGTATGVVYWVARARAEGRAHDVPAIMRTALVPVVVLGTVVALITVAGASGLSQLILGAHARAGSATLRALAIFIPVAGAEAVWLAAVRGFGTMRVNAAVELIGRPLLQLLLVAAVLPAHHGVVTALAWGAPYAVAAALAARAWSRRRAALPPAPQGEPAPDAAAFWRFTAPRALTSVIQMVMQRFDIVLVGALAGAPAAAVYTAATRFVVAGQSATMAFTQAVQPRLGEALVRDQYPLARQLYQYSTAWLIALAWPVYLVVLVYRTTLLGVFGHGYDAGAGVLVWLAVSMLWSTGCGLVDVVLAMAGRTGWNLANSLLALVVNVGLDLWLIPDHGLVGAAIGWAAAIAVRNLVALFLVWWTLGLQPVSPVGAAAVGLALGSFVIVPMSVRLVAGDSAPALLVALGLGSVAWLVGARAGIRTFGIRSAPLPNVGDHRRMASPPR